MENTTRKRGRPRIEVTQDVLEARRLARQRYNARRTEVATNTAAILLKPRSAVSASEFPRRRTNINKKKADFATNNTKLDIGAQDQYQCRYRVKCGSLAGTHKIFQRQRVAGMTTPTQSEGDLYSTANSSESLVDPIHYSLSQSLPLEERYKLDRDWKRNEAEHSYSEAKKNYELHMGLQVHNKTIRKHVADLKAGNTSLSSQAQETKSLVDNLTAYKGHLEEDRLRELLMLQWRLNGSAAELEEGKSFLNDLIDTENGGRS